MFIFSVFLRVPSAVCNYLICMVWGGFWNLYGFVLLLGSFGCAIIDTPSHTAFIGGQFSWSPHQETIGPCHSFDVFVFFFFPVYLSYFSDFRSFLFGLLAP
jgi:hypothetical protein